MTMLLPRWKASSEIVPWRGLSRRRADLRRFDAVIGGVADQVDHRVAQLVDHPLVEFGLLAADRQADVLAVGPRNVADHAMEPAEQRPDRQHPHVHDALLDAVADGVEQMNGFEEVVDAGPGLGQRLRLAVYRLELVLQTPCGMAETLGFRAIVRSAPDRRGAAGHLLQFRGDAVEDLGRLLPDDGLLQPLADLRHAGLADGQLAGEIHQSIQPLDVHAQGFGRFDARLDRGGDALGGRLQSESLGVPAVRPPSRGRPRRASKRCTSSGDLSVAMPKQSAAISSRFSMSATGGSK